MATDEGEVVHGGTRILDAIVANESAVEVEAELEAKKERPRGFDFELELGYGEKDELRNC